MRIFLSGNPALRVEVERGTPDVGQMPVDLRELGIVAVVDCEGGRGRFMG